MTTKFSMSFKGWDYSFEHDDETGELTVLSRKQRGVVQKAVEYAKAESSRLVWSLPLPQIDARREACASCESMEDDQGNWYCKSCGCPKWDRSRLQVKWEMPAARCPLGKWPG